MASNPLSPNGEPHRPSGASGERPFGLSEIFFSITDRKGIILSGNEVFTRVSGYPREAMVGRPHNLVRHDDMPRVVFKVFWDEILAGRPIAAYVKNRASDGRYYWVIAMAMPASEGFLSIRIKPTSELFPVVQGLYRELRELERGIEGPNGLRRKEAMEASAKVLLAKLAEAGFPTYDAFMRAAILAEVRLREEHLQRDRSAANINLRNLGGDATSSLRKANSLLTELVLRLDEYGRLNARLAENAAFIRDLTDEIRLFALNAIVAASKAGGADGAAIGAVAGLLRSNSESSAAMFRALGDSVVAASETIGEMLFPVAAARLQGEMLEKFMAERGSEAAGDRDASDVQALHGCLERETGGLVRLLNEFDRRMNVLQTSVQDLRFELKAMRALSLNGRIEAARIENHGQFTNLFATIGERVAAAGVELDELGKSCDRLFTHHGESASEIERAVAAAGAAIEARIAASEPGIAA